MSGQKSIDEVLVELLLTVVARNLAPREEAPEFEAAERGQLAGFAKRENAASVEGERKLPEELLLAIRGGKLQRDLDGFWDFQS